MEGAGQTSPDRAWPELGSARVPYWVYQAPDVYALEQTRIFSGPTGTMSGSKPRSPTRATIAAPSSTMRRATNAPGVIKCWKKSASNRTTSCVSGATGSWRGRVDRPGPGAATADYPRPLLVGGGGGRLHEEQVVTSSAFLATKKHEGHEEDTKAG